MQRRSIGIPCAGVLGLVLPLAPLAAQEAGEPAAVVERIEILNNQYLQRETLLFYISTKAGDPYDVGKLRQDFKRLWDTGFLDDLQIEVVDGQRGKIVRFKVTERKRIQIVDFRGSPPWKPAGPALTPPWRRLIDSIQRQTRLRSRAGFEVLAPFGATPAAGRRRGSRSRPAMRG